jgi:hypothetical protein
MREKRNMYRLLVGKPEGKRPFRRQRQRQMHSIKMDLVQVGWGDVEWTGLAQDREKWSSCECSNEPSGSIKCWETIERLYNRRPLE